MLKRSIKLYYFIYIYIYICIYREQAPSTWVVAAYPRPALLAAAKWTDHAPISFDQQAQCSHGHTSCIKKENSNTEVHCGGGLEPVKLACDRASSRLKPCASLENSQRILSVRRSLFALVGRKQTMVRDHIYPKQSLVRALGSRAQVLSTPHARQQSSCPRP